MRGAFTMTYLERIYQTYHRASKTQKGRMLDELCRVCGIARKYAIRRLAGPPPEAGRSQTPPVRPRTYGPTVLALVATVWRVAGYPWSARLKVMLRLWLPWIRRRFRPAPQTERRLVTISPATLDRALRGRKRALRRRLYTHTKPGTLLRRQVPVQTSRPTVDGPGHVEVDLVAHCGGSATGEFIYSLNLTDLATGWVETRALLGKGETGVLAALRDVRETLPFPLVSLDSDNGSEFLNWSLVRYCQATGLQFTRSRPYKKDDNAHIEQKNWTHVRKLIGWDRYETPAAQAALNALYRHALRLWMNGFQPSVRLVEITRRGSRLTRRYDAPQTPLDRLRRSPQGHGPRRQALLVLRERTDPFELAAQVQRHLAHIWRLAQGRPVAPLTRPGSRLGLPPEKQAAALARLFPRMPAPPAA